MQEDTPARLRWRSCSQGSLVWRTWGAESVVYHRPSGKTHFVNESSRWLMTDVLREPKSVEDIVAVFAPAGADPDSNELHAEVGALLARLEYLGLIDRA